MLAPLVLLLSAPTPMVGADMMIASVTLPQLKEQATWGFKLMDVDRDGYVTKADITQAAEGALNRFRTPGSAPLSLPPLSLQLFDESDPNHDGRISLEEHLAGVEKQFTLDDADHDGVVTGKERLAGAIRQAQHMLDQVRTRLKAR